MDGPHTSGDDIVFDSLQQNDLAAVERIERASFSSPWPRRSFGAALRQPHCFNLAARRDQALIGYLIAVVHPPTVLIANLAVDSDWRRSRLGTRLMKRALAAGVEAGCEYSVLDVRPSNSGAIRLYESLGYRPVGRRPGYYRDPPEDALTMARLL